MLKLVIVLFTERDSEFHSDVGFILGLIEELPLSKLRPSKNTLRASVTDIEPLAASIRQKGLLQPILVRPTEDDHFEVVAGNRRFNACKLLQWKKIPCHIAELDEKSAYEVSLIENVQRRNMNPVEEAEAYKRYSEEFGWGSASDLAKRIGKSKSYISKRIALLALPKEVLDKLQSREITPSAAEELLRLDNEADQSRLARLVAERHLSMRKVRNLATDQDVDMIQTDSESAACTSSITLERTERAFDKTILALKVALSKMGSVIETVEDNWVAYELLLQHKNSLHSQIDILLKQKKALRISRGLLLVS